MPKIVDWKERQKKAQERNKKFAKNRAPKTKVYTIRVYYDSEIYTATEKAAEKMGKQPGNYLRIALIEKLQRDGYMSQNSDAE